MIIGFDTETTSIDPSAEDFRVVELAWNAYADDYRKLSETDLLVKLPDGWRMPPDATAVNHITDDMLDSFGTSEEEAAHTFAQVIENAREEGVLLVAYNANFDVPAMQKMFKRIPGLEEFDWRTNIHVLDPLGIDRDYFAYPNKLVNAIDHWGAEGVVNSHRANDDVDAMMEVVKQMQKSGVDIPAYYNIIGQNPLYPLSERIDGVRYRMQPVHWPKYGPGEYTLPDKDFIARVGELAASNLDTSPRRLDAADSVIKKAIALRKKTSDVYKSLGAFSKETADAEIEQIREQYNNSLSFEEKKFLGDYWYTPDSKAYQHELQDYKLEDLERMRAHLALWTYIGSGKDPALFDEISPDWRQKWCRINNEVTRSHCMKQLEEFEFFYSPNEWGDPVFTDADGHPHTFDSWKDAQEYWFNNRAKPEKPKVWTREQVAGFRTTDEVAKRTEPLMMRFRTDAKVLEEARQQATGWREVVKDEDLPF